MFIPHGQTRPHPLGYTFVVSEPAGMWVPREQRSFGGFELIAKLATGGMAEIFLARSPNADEPLVLKRILPHLAEDEHFVQMFRDEAALAKQLVHPNICRVQHLGNEGSAWFIVMEHVHGVSLARMMTLLSKRLEVPDYRTVGGIMTQACHGLHYAHDARGPSGQPLGIVHRDISPPNIMVSSAGQAKLLDFGIAKANTAQTKTRSGTLKGKNAYMSPEQILGRTLDRRSDIFALGTVLWELLAIKRLFHRDSDFMTYRAITEEPTPDIRQHRPDIPGPLREVVERALAKHPADRFANAAEFARALTQSIAILGGPATANDLMGFMETRFAAEIARQDEILKAATRSTGERPALRMVRDSGGRFGSDSNESTELALAATPVPSGDLAGRTLPLEAIDVRSGGRWGWPLAVAALVIVVAVGWLALGGNHTSPTATTSSPAATADARLASVVDARRTVAPADEPDDRAKIAALSKYGFVSMTSNAPATVYINGKLIGETPLQRVPIPPGIHKVKAVGPKKAVQQFDLTVYGGKDADARALKW